MKFDIDATIEVLTSMVQALPVTLSLSFLVLFLSFLLGAIFALIEYLDIRVLSKLVKVYTSFFRGTPLVAQLFFFYFGLPALFPAFLAINGYIATVIIMSMNSAAYIKEAIRGALFGVDKGQVEAGMSLGYKENQIIQLIVIPQALRIAVPSLANCFIDIIKGSSLAFTVGVIEITAAAKLYSASTLNFFEGYAGLIVMYWIITIIMERLLRLLEFKLNKSY